VRLKLLRRRLSVSAPRMIVRSRLPWPVRWAVIAAALGLSAALALWAFEFGKGITGIAGISGSDRSAREELAALRERMQVLTEERERAISVANAAEGLLKAERVSQEKLAEQLKQAEAEVLRLKADLGFFERLLPAAGGDDLAIRSLQVEPRGPGTLRLQVLMIRAGRHDAEFVGRYTVTLTGTLEGRPWTEDVKLTTPQVRMRQYARVEHLLNFSEAAVVKAVQVRVLDERGSVRASQSTKL
jgi:hypothetical protein